MDRIEIVRTWFSKNECMNEVWLRKCFVKIIRRYEEEHCLQEIYDVLFKIQMHDVYVPIAIPYYEIFDDALRKLDINKYRFDDKCIRYNIPMYSKNELEKADITIFRVLNWFREHVDRTLLFDTLYSYFNLDYSVFLDVFNRRYKFVIS